MQQEQNMFGATAAPQPEYSPEAQRQERDRQEIESLRKELDRMELCVRAAEKNLLKEKKLKDVYIERSKLQRRELDKLTYYDEEGRLSNQKIAQLAKERTRHTNKKNIQEDYEELQVAHMRSQKELQDELEKEREKSKALQRELDNIKVSHVNSSSRLDTEDPVLRQQTDFYLHQLEWERRIHREELLEAQRIISELRDEKDTVHHEMTLEISSLKENAYAMELEVEELKLQLSLKRLDEPENENLEEALNTCREELQQEKEKNQCLYGDNCALSTSLNKLQKNYDTVVVDISEKCDIIYAHELKIRAHEETIEKMRSEKEALEKEHAEELSQVKEQALRTTEALTTQLSLQISLNQELMMERETRKSQTETIRVQEETTSEPSQKGEVPPETQTIRVQEETMESEESASEGPSTQHQEDLEEQTLEQDSLSEDGAVGGLQSEGEAEVSGTTRNPSAWKKFRHAVGLRKPKRWKKQKRSSTPEPPSSDSLPSPTSSE